MTSRRQILLFTEETLTSSAEASHVNPTVQQAKDWGKMTSDISGPICLDAFGRFPRVGLWGKTFSALLIGQEGWFSTRCRLTWKLKGTRFNRLFFQLQASTLPTEGTEFGLLPTPRANQVNGMDLNNEKLAKRNKSNLEEEVAKWVVEGMLPTPTTDSATNRKDKYKQGGTPLSVAVNKMLPTPTTSCANGGTKAPRKDGKTRESELNHWATINRDEAQATGKTSQLNPQFVEEMMGFPENWTLSPFQSGETNPSKPTETQ